jgi:Tfp pilus assembly protein PilF
MIDLAREDKHIQQQLQAGWEKFVAADYEAALREFESVLLVEEERAMACTVAAACLSRLGQAEEAEPLARKGVALAPQVTFTHLILAEVLVALKQADEAEAELWEALALEPHNAELQTDLGRFLLMRDEREKARERIERAIEMQPDYAEAHFLLAICFGQVEEIDRAFAETERTLELAPTHARAHAFLSALFIARSQRFKKKAEKLAEFKRAQAALRRAVELDPTNEKTKKDLQVLNQRVWQYEGAIEQGKQARKDILQSLVILAVLIAFLIGVGGFASPFTIAAIVISAIISSVKAWQQRRREQQGRSDFDASGLLGLGVAERSPSSPDNNQVRRD